MYYKVTKVVVYDTEEEALTQYTKEQMTHNATNQYEKPMLQVIKSDHDEPAYNRKGSVILKDFNIRNGEEVVVDAVAMEV